MISNYWKKHDNLVILACEFLKARGVHDVELEKKIELPPGVYRQSAIVDIAAVAEDGKSLVMECGIINSMAVRLPAIIEHFDHVYWMPMAPFVFKLVGKTSPSSGNDALPHTCLRCTYQWYSRIPNPGTCPHCGSRSWRIQRVVTARKVVDRSLSKVMRLLRKARAIEVA